MLKLFTLLNFLRNNKPIVNNMMFVGRYEVIQLAYMKC